MCQSRTALDCLAALPFGDALDLYAWLTTRDVLTRAGLAAAVRQRYGRQGTPQLVTLVSRTRNGATSAAEQRLHRLLRDAGIRGWVAGAAVDDAAGRIGVVDVLFAAAHLVVEVDGRRAHDRPDVFVQDRRRQDRLVMAGYVVLRFTWQDLVERPDVVVRQITDALAGAASRR